MSCIGTWSHRWAKQFVSTITPEPLHSAWWYFARTWTYTIVVHNAVFRLSIAWSVPEIFAIKVWSCPKSSALLITREPLHSDWWNFARTCTSTTSRILLNFKVKGQGHMGFDGVFLCAWCCGNPRAVLSLEQGLVFLLQWVLYWSMRPSPVCRPASRLDFATGEAAGPACRRTDTKTCL